jgi:hypothetical protein
MARSIRTKIYLKEANMLNNSDYNKQIYKKNLTWHPPPAPIQIEDKITEFEKALKKLQESNYKRHKHCQISNLNPLQLSALRQLRQNKNVTIKPTDKNLGPAAMDTSDYIQQVLQEHLLTNAYKQLTFQEANNIMTQLKTFLKNLLSEQANTLPKSELTFFQRSLKEHHRLPVFYGLPKVHKQPISLRPVVSTSGSLLAIFSTWIDFKMKTLLPLIQSYVQNSINVTNELRDIILPDNALIFTADAISMYTNIDTDIGIQSIRDFLTYNMNSIPTDFPHELFLQILEIVMKNNIFSFADTYWLQLTGTAMGTPAACAYATITFGHYENSVILKDFKNELLFYKRYIDDIIGVWVPPATNDPGTWYNFKNKLNNWGNLKWKVEEPSTRSTFLDLDIQLQNKRFIFKTYQKDMNLYLYIPPSSAHPPSCFKGLIAGELRRYWLQNNPSNFQDILSSFIQRLVARGHTINSITPILLNAAELLDKGHHNEAPSKATGDDTLFIHRVFHPYGLSRTDIRYLYSKILQPYLDFDKMIIAMSRPTNLRDVLTKATMTPPANLDINNLIKTMRQQSANVIT